MILVACLVMLACAYWIAAGARMVTFPSALLWATATWLACEIHHQIRKEKDDVQEREKAERRRALH